MSYPTFLTRVEREIRDERDRQDAKWGEQNHPDGTGPLMSRTTARDAARNRTDEAAKRGEVTWLDILREEWLEATCEDNPAALRAELIQVAAVAQQWVEAIDRRPQDGGEATYRCDRCGDETVAASLPAEWITSGDSKICGACWRQVEAEAIAERAGQPADGGGSQ